MAETKRVTRKELYEQVWSKPMQKLAKEYGLSDVGLAKICKKHNIPRPYRGYWAQILFGQVLQRDDLPNPENNPTIDITAHAPDALLSGLDADIQKLAQEPVPVPTTLRGAHAYVHAANETLQSAEITSTGELKLPDSKCLYIDVSKKSLHRALCIMDGLIKGLLARKYEVSLAKEGCGAHASIMGFDIEFQIEELQVVNKVEPEVGDLKGHYYFRHDREKSVQVLSGELRICIGNESRLWGHHGVRRRWTDSPRQRLEDSLHKVIAGMMTYALVLAEIKKKDDEREAQYEKEQARQLKEERRQEKRAARIREEAQKVETLFQEAKDWRSSIDLREYIAAARANAVKAGRSVSAGSEFDKWQKWATEQADMLDPFVTDHAFVKKETTDEETC